MLCVALCRSVFAGKIYKINKNGAKKFKKTNIFLNCHSSSSGSRHIL